MSKFYEVTVSLPDRHYTVEADNEKEAIDIAKSNVLGESYFVLDGGKVSPDAISSYSPSTLLTGQDVDMEDAHCWVAACGSDGRSWLESLEVIEVAESEYC